MTNLEEFIVSDEIATQLEQEETPMRINTPQTTYYILSAEQLAILLQPNIDTGHSFTPDDFGLTSDELAAYLDRRARRRTYVSSANQEALNETLEQRLSLLRFGQPFEKRQSISPEESLLQMLEQAMQDNLQAVVTNRKRNKGDH